MARTCGRGSGLVRWGTRPPWRGLGYTSRCAIRASRRTRRSGSGSGASEGFEGESMKKAFVIGALLVVLTLSLGGTGRRKGTHNGRTHRQHPPVPRGLPIAPHPHAREAPPKEP